MTEVDILMISGLLGYTVQRDILEPCHGNSDTLSLQSGTEYARTCQANVVHGMNYIGLTCLHASWCDANLCHIFECWWRLVQQHLKLAETCRIRIGWSSTRRLYVVSRRTSMQNLFGVGYWVPDVNVGRDTFNVMPNSSPLLCNTVTVQCSDMITVNTAIRVDILP